MVAHSFGIWMIILRVGHTRGCFNRLVVGQDVRNLWFVQWNLRHYQSFVISLVQFHSPAFTWKGLALRRGYNSLCNIFHISSPKTHLLNVMASSPIPYYLHLPRNSGPYARRGPRGYVAFNVNPRGLTDSHWYNTRCKGPTKAGLEEEESVRSKGGMGGSSGELGNGSLPINGDLYHT